MDRELSVGIEAMLEKNENIPFPKFTITAYTNPENTSSERVLERCGFERKGKMAYEEGDEEKDDLWVLNWGKLRQIFATRDEMAQQGRDQT
jgi:hypothetical protein